MPKFLEKALASGFAKRKAEGKLKGVSEGQYVYGGMNRMGAMRGSKITPKGRRMEKKHNEKMRKLSELA